MAPVAAVQLREDNKVAVRVLFEREGAVIVRGSPAFDLNLA